MFNKGDFDRMFWAIAIGGAIVGFLGAAGIAAFVIWLF